MRRTAPATPYSLPDPAMPRCARSSATPDPARTPWARTSPAATRPHAATADPGTGEDRAAARRRPAPRDRPGPSGHLAGAGDRLVGDAGRGRRWTARTGAIHRPRSHRTQYGVGQPEHRLGAGDPARRD